MHYIMMYAWNVYISNVNVYVCMGCVTSRSRTKFGRVTTKKI